MAGKKNSGKKEEIIEVNLATIDRKRMEYRWGMESFFRSHKIEAENYKEALGRYGESCLVFMSEKDIKKIEKEKNINVKRIPYINLHKIRREKPLGRWMVNKFFKNCEIRENRYKKELEAYNEACRLHMKPEEIAVIAEKLQCRTSEFAFSEEIVDLSEIRRRLEETALKEIFIECGIDINKYDDKFFDKVNSLRLQMTLKDVKKIAEILQCEATKLLNSDNQVNLSEIKRRIKDKKLKEFFDECKIDINKYEDNIYEQARKLQMNDDDRSVIAKKLECEEKDILDTDNKVNLSKIKRMIKPKKLKDFFAECEIDINKYEDDIYKQATKLQMDDKDREVIIGKFRNPVIKKFLNLEESKFKVKLSKLRNQPEVKTLKEFLNEKKVDIGKYRDILSANTILMDVKDTEKVIEELQCKVEEILELESSELIVEISKLKQQIEEKELIKKEALEDFYSVFRSSEEEWEQVILECEKRFFIAKSFFEKYTIKMDRYEEEIYNQIYMLNISLEDAEKLQYKFSNIDVSEVVDLFELKQRIEENAIKSFFAEHKIKGYDQAIQTYEKSGFIKAKRADIDKIEQNKKLQEKSFVKNAVDLYAIQSQLKEQESIGQLFENCGIGIQNYKEELDLTMKEDDIEKLAKSLQCKREEIEIEQKQVNLLQIEEKIEKIAREKWSTLEGFFKSIGVNGDYWEKIDQYENQDFIECKLSWIDKISDNIIYYSSGKCKGDWRDLLCKDEMNYIQECINKSKYYNKSSKENNLKNLAKNFGCTLEELPEKLGKEKYKVKAVELERKQKYIHVEWQEGSIYKTLSKLLKDELEDTKLLQSQSRTFNNHRIIPIKKEDCKKIVDALTCNINDISDEMVDWDFKNNPELRENSVLSVTNRSHIDFSGICRKRREAEEKQRTTCKIQRSILAQIANSKGYETEDLEARDIDVVKDNIKEELSKYSTQMKRKILQELLEEASNRIEYIKTETGYDCVIYFKGEKYDITDIPELPEGEDIVQHLTNAIESDLAERMNEIPGDVYEEFHKLPMEKIEVSEKQLSPQECQIVLEKIILLLERMDDDCKTEEEQRKVAYNEMSPFTQEMCDYYEVPNPFNIEE